MVSWLLLFYVKQAKFSLGMSDREQAVVFVLSQCQGQLNHSKPVPEASQVGVCGYLLSATLRVFSPAPQGLFQQQGSAHIHQVYYFQPWMAVLWS